MKERNEISNWNSNYKNQINPSTGVNWTLTEFVQSPGALGVEYGTLYDYCREEKAKAVPSKQQNVMIAKSQLKRFITSRLRHANNSRSQVGVNFSWITDKHAISMRTMSKNN